MYSYRITKYNPINRDKKGIYKAEEWISYSEIGESFNGKNFTLKEYLTVEEKYINAIFTFLDELSINKLEIKELEAYDDFGNLRNGDEKESKNLKKIIRDILLEKMWCMLEYTDEIKIHFGYDYYMYIVTKKECIKAIGKVVELGLFLEKFKSPYL